MKQEFVKDLFDYDPETGMFRRKKITHANQKAGWHEGSRGLRYITLRIDGVNVYAHRVAWLWMTGEWPEIVDHINGDSFDNRFANLRSATKSTNMMNSKQRSDNTSGCRGVVWDEGFQQYHAYINIAGVRHQRHYDSFEVAKAWRESMAAELHGEFQPSERAQNSHVESGSSQLLAALGIGNSHVGPELSLGNSNVGHAGATANHNPITS